MRDVAISLIFALYGCATSRSAESHSEAVISQTVRDEEGGWVRKTWEYAPRGDVVEPEEPGTSALAQEPAPVKQGQERRGNHAEVVGKDPTGGPLPGSVLLKYTEEVHSPVKTTTEQLNSVKADSTSESRYRFGPGFWGWLALGFGAVAAIGLGVKFKVWKFFV